MHVYSSARHRRVGLVSKLRLDVACYQFLRPIYLELSKGGVMKTEEFWWSTEITAITGTYRLEALNVNTVNFQTMD